MYRTCFDRPPTARAQSELSAHNLPQVSRATRPPYPHGRHLYPTLVGGVRSGPSDGAWWLRRGAARGAGLGV